MVLAGADQLLLHHRGGGEVELLALLLAEQLLLHHPGGGEAVLWAEVSLAEQLLLHQSGGGEAVLREELRDELVLAYNLWEFLIFLFVSQDPHLHQVGVGEGEDSAPSATQCCSQPPAGSSAVMLLGVREGPMLFQSFYLFLAWFSCLVYFQLLFLLQLPVFFFLQLL